MMRRRGLSLSRDSRIAVQTTDHRYGAVLPIRGAGLGRRFARRAFLEEDPAIRGTRPAGFNRLYGPGQLGHRDRGRLALWLQSAVRRAAIESRGDGAAMPEHASGHRYRARSRAIVECALLATGGARAMAARGIVDRGLRPRRSARRRARVPSALQLLADHRRAADRLRHADRARPEGQEFSRSRSDHAWPDRDDRRGLHHRTGVGEAALAVGRARPDSVVAGAEFARAHVSGDRHPRRDGDAAQSLSAFVDRADPRGEARLGRHPLGDQHVADRHDCVAGARAADQYGDPDSRRRRFSFHRSHAGHRRSKTRTGCWRRSSAPVLRRCCSPSRCSRRDKARPLPARWRGRSSWKAS